MNLVLSQDQSRHLALGLLLLALLILALIIYIPTRILHDRYDVPLQKMTDSLQRYQNIIVSREQLQTSLDEIRRRNTQRYFLKSPVPSLAASEIQEIAKNLIETNGGQLASMQIEPILEEDGYRRITVSIQMSIHIRALGKLLYALESRRPYLYVDFISIVSRINPRYNGPDIVDPELQVNFDLSGYARAEPL